MWRWCSTDISRLPSTQRVHLQFCAAQFLINIICLRKANPRNKVRSVHNSYSPTFATQSPPISLEVSSQCRFPTNFHPSLNLFGTFHTGRMAILQLRNPGIKRCKEASCESSGQYCEAHGVWSLVRGARLFHSDVWQSAFFGSE